MFAKNKPVKRVPLGEENWVDLQCLSKGIKDSFSSAVADLYNDLKIDESGNPDKSSIPAGIVGKVNEIQYRKVAAAIRSWSANDVLVSVEAVKELDEESFDKILESVNAMNEMSKEEEKN